MLLDSFLVLKWVNLHWYIEEDGQEELVVDGHRNKAALVELRGGFPHHDAQANTPE